MLRHAIVLAVLAATPAFAGPTFIAFQVPGAESTVASSINSAGDVTGYFSDQSGIHGFVRLHDGTFQTFDAGAPSSLQPFKINDRGEVVGECHGKHGPLGFLRSSDGTIKTFKLLGGGVLARALNNAGAVTGTTNDGVSTHGYIRKPSGAFALFDIPGIVPISHAINDSGTILGSYIEGSEGRAFLRDRKGVVTMLHTSSNFFPRALNNAGAVAGDDSFDGAVVAPDGTVTTFIVTQGLRSDRSTTVEDINGDGAITGWYTENPEERPRSFLRKPDGKVQRFRYPVDQSSTYAMAINDSYVITGYFSGAGVPWTAFLRFP